MTDPRKKESVWGTAQSIAAPQSEEQKQLNQRLEVEAERGNVAYLRLELVAANTVIDELRSQLAEAEARERTAFEAGMVCATVGWSELPEHLEADEPEEIAVREQAYQAYRDYQAAKKTGGA